MNRAPPSPTGRRFALAVGLGHFAGAYAFCAAAIAAAAFSDLRTEGIAAITPHSWGRLIEGICAFPVAIGLIALWAAVLMVPLTVLALPIAWLAAYRFRTGALVTLALGAVTGLAVPAVASLGGAGPAFDLHVAPAAAGTAFAGVIWRLCIRPRIRPGHVGSR